MTTTRRKLLSSLLLGSGALALRSLATGLPIAVLAKGARRAFADGSASTCPNKSKAQYVIFQTSAGGDPINANCPGSYTDAGIYHSPDPSMAATAVSLGGFATQAAQLWASTTAGGLMPQWALDRSTFWHIQTNTVVHAAEGDVLKLNGESSPAEMLPSLLSRQLAPCLGTVQTPPIAVGGSGLSYGGEALPLMPPLAVKETLVSPQSTLLNLQKLRDDTLSKVDAIYRGQATTAQSKYLDSLVTTRQQVRSINDNLVSVLSNIKDNSVTSQIDVALALIQMNISPVISLYIPFGHDNHVDPGLATEISEHKTGIASIAYLMGQLQTLGLQDQVTFMSLNVFGRTIGSTSVGGRQHNGNHEVSITIGNGFKPGVVGGPMPYKGDYGAMPISSSSGVGGAGGDISSPDTLGAFGQTVMAGLGGDPTTVSSLFSAGKIIQGALA